MPDSGISPVREDAFRDWWENTILPAGTREDVAHEIFCAGWTSAPAAELPPIDGEPLTHFFHCWRFPSHQKCAIALIERQARENDELLVQADEAKRQRLDWGLET